MALTEMIVARIDENTAKRMAREVRERCRTGARVAGADITREALIEYFARKDDEKRQLLAKGAK